MTLPSLAQITNYEAEAVTRPLEQYQNRPRLLALLLSFVRRCQEIENAAWDVILKRMIDNAQNAQLDTIGKLVGQIRNGQDDATYRVYITARIRINRSHGHPDDVIQVLQLIESTAFQYTEYSPASAVVSYLTPPNTSPTLLLSLAKLAIDAGVKLFLIAPFRGAPDDYVTFCDVGSVSNPDQGLGTVTSSLYGGALVSVYA